MKRLPPKNFDENLGDLLKISDDLSESLPSSVYQPLKVAKDKTNGREYLLSDYNRDFDHESYR